MIYIVRVTQPHCFLNGVEIKAALYLKSIEVTCGLWWECLAPELLSGVKCWQCNRIFTRHKYSEGSPEAWCQPGKRVWPGCLCGLWWEETHAHTFPKTDEEHKRKHLLSDIEWKAVVLCIKISTCAILSTLTNSKFDWVQKVGSGPGTHLLKVTDFCILGDLGFTLYLTMVLQWFLAIPYLVLLVWFAIRLLILIVFSIVIAS